MATRTLANTTRIAILIDDDTGNVAELVATITVLVAILINFSRFIYEVALLVGDVIEASRFTVVVFDIILRSLAWGFWGVRL